MEKLIERRKLMKKLGGVKLLGIFAALVGIGASLFSSFVEDRKMDEKISKAVQKALEHKE